MSRQVITVSSLYGAATRQPLVQVQWADLKPFTLTVEEARDLAANLLENAEAAEQDAFMVEFGINKLGGEREGALLLAEFRKWREGRR